MVIDAIVVLSQWRAPYTKKTKHTTMKSWRSSFTMISYSPLIIVKVMKAYILPLRYIPAVYSDKVICGFVFLDFEKCRFLKINAR